MAEQQTFCAVIKKPADEAQKIRAVRAYIAEHPDLFGLICCAVSARAENVYSLLKKSGLAVACELPSGERGGGLQAFRDGKARILIVLSGAVPADMRADIRYVLHYNLPFSPEDYARDLSCACAGKNGAECILYYHPKDRKLAENHFRRMMLESRTEEDRERIKHLKESYTGMIRLYGMPSAEAAEAMRKEIQKRLPAGEEKTATGQGRLEKKRVTANVRTKSRKTGDPDRKGKIVRRPADRTLCVNRSPAAEKIRAGEDGRLTCFDLMTADAAYTLIRQRVKLVYAKHIMELLSGNSALTLRPEKKEEVENSLRKVMQEGLLSLKEETGGFSYDAEKQPSFYAEAEEKNQIRTIPAEALRVEGMPASSENLALTHYLYCRTAAGDEKLRMTELWKALRITFPEGKYYRHRKETTILEKTRRILKHFRDRGIIRGFVIPETGEEILIEYRP